MKTRLERALEYARQPGGDVATAVHELGDYAVRRVRDAEAIIGLLEAAVAGDCPLPTTTDSGMISPLHAVVSLFQEVASRKAFFVLASRGVPLLMQLFDERMAEAHDDDAESLLFLLKVSVMYQAPQAVERLVQAARSPVLANHYLWTVIFSIVSDQGDDFAELVCEALRHPLPGGFAAVAYLDLCNALCRNSRVKRHPFNVFEGHRRLENWLRSRNPQQHSYAHSAAASLPFMRASVREPLLALALDHQRASVQLEGAWASARLKSEGGVKLLRRYCQDPRYSANAREYLEELGRGEEVPGEAMAPDFEAQAEMCRWLSHPMEFGAPPDEIELYDSCEIYWPPTRDVRRLWLLRYAYQPTKNKGQREIGVGMVGSVTYALFGETTADKSPDDIYALHCCWELQRNGDPRAPRVRTIAAGRAILERESK